MPLPMLSTCCTGLFPRRFTHKKYVSSEEPERIQIARQMHLEEKKKLAKNLAGIKD